MIQLRVWLCPPAGSPYPVGELMVADPSPRRGGRVRGEFRYLEAYLGRPDAFPLDPIHLPLQLYPFDAGRPHAGIHGVFEDSLPDEWGRRILCRRHGLTPARSRPADLLALIGRQALGALAYTQGPDPQDAPGPVPATELRALMEAARRFEEAPADAPVDDLMRLFQAASSPGGARPKVLVEDRGVGWLVKLPSSRDHCDMVRLEAASLRLAQTAGIEVPRHRLIELQGRSALMLRRFDQTAAGGGRNHVVSLRTLLGADGWYQAGYSDLAEAVRRVSDRPERDLPALYRQMVFNAVLGNTDDHLKNFALLHGAGGWRLSPAYDLLPDIFERREHVLHFGTAGPIPTAAALDDLARSFGVAPVGARHVRQQVLAAVAAWRGQMRAVSVPEADIERFGGSISRRLSRLAG